MAAEAKVMEAKVEAVVAVVAVAAAAVTEMEVAAVTETEVAVARRLAVTEMEAEAVTETVGAGFSWLHSRLTMVLEQVRKHAGIFQ